MNDERQETVTDATPRTNLGAERRPLTLDEIMAIVEDIARTGEGADRMRALKLLTSLQQTGVVIPPPLRPHERIDRLARLMPALGRNQTMIAFGKAFKTKGKIKTPGYIPPMDVDTAPPELLEKARKTTTLKKLYALNPSCRPRAGVPKGFPVHGSVLSKAEWCQKQTLKYLLELEQRESQNALDEEMDALRDQET